MEGILGDDLGEGNCESKIVSRQWGDNFCPETSRCLAGPSGFAGHPSSSPFLSTFWPFSLPQKVLCSVEEGAQHRAWRGAVSGWTSPHNSGRKFLPEICVKTGQDSVKPTLWTREPPVLYGFYSVSEAPHGSGNPPEYVATARV